VRITVVTAIGGGKIDLDVDTEELSTIISGSGKADLRGEADTHNIVISGSGKIYCFDLSTEKSDVIVSGSGNCEIDVSEELNVKISGRVQSANSAL